MKRSKKMMIVATGLCWLMIISTAGAQVSPLDTLTFQLKSPAGAQAISVLSTIGPVACGLLSATQGEDSYGTPEVVLILSGITVGPSMGYFYGGKTARGFTGIGVRVGIGALTAMAASGAAANAAKDDQGFGFPDLEAAMTVGAVGAGIIAISAIYDIAAVRNAVEKRNSELIRRSQTSVKVFPKYFADSGAAGIQLQMNF
jgi:hypothetical protein